MKKSIVSFMIAVGVGAAVITGCGSTSGDEQSASIAFEASDESVSNTETESSVSPEEKASYAEAEEKLNTYKKTDSEWELPKTGISLKITDSMKNMKGQIRPNDYGQTGDESGVYYAVFDYVPRTDEEVSKASEQLASISDDNDPDLSRRKAIWDEYFGNGFLEMFYIVGYKNDMTMDEAIKSIGFDKSMFSKTEEIGESGAMKYACLMLDLSTNAEDFKSLMTEEFYSDMETVVGDLDNILEGVTIKEIQ